MRDLIVGIVIGIAVFAIMYSCATSAKADTSGVMEASYYASELAGSPTACSGTPYDPSAMVAAHKSLPCGTRLLVRHEGRGVVVTVDDRGPFVAGRDLDLSEGAASVIGLKEDGVGEVEVSEVPSSTSETLPETGGI